MRHLIVCLLICCSISSIWGQEQLNISKHTLSVTKARTVYPSNYKNQYDFVLRHVELPTPGGDGVKDHLADLKKNHIPNLYPRQSSIKSNKTNDLKAENPIKGESFYMARPYVPVLDSAYAVTGGTPLDNTIAVSNGGILMASINTKIYAHDLNADTAMLNVGGSENTLGFSFFASKEGITTDSPFDPKLIYDPNRDRFVLVFVSGRDENNSKLIVCFSSSNNPADPWHIYELPGNPRDTNNWSDYPALSITDKDLFLTINMIIPNVSWQVGFDGSIIWQMDLDQAFAGDTATQVTWWDDIKFGDQYIRNLNPILYGVEPDSSNAFFVSNRNFDLLNDSIFLLEITNSIESGQAQLKIQQGELDLPYGMPPNGRQADTDTTDASTGLQTNDARWLGGFILEDRIQFVGNSINHQNGNASIYHGTIADVYSDQPVFKGKMISDDKLDYGYPNIVFTGTQTCEQQAIIAFDHTSMDDFPGVSAVYYSNEGLYSDVIKLKKGIGIIDNPPLQNDPYERWGDYFGLQRIYNQPGTVWSAGMWGLNSTRSATWLAEIIAPDTHQMMVTLDTINDPFNNCLSDITVEAAGGISPYQIILSNDTLQSDLFPVNICDGNYLLKIKDSLNCQASFNLEFADSARKEIIEIQNNRIYPNPFTDNFNLLFESSEDLTLRFELYDDRGRLIEKFGELPVLKGMNELSFSTIPIRSGLYFLKIFNNDALYLESKLLKITDQ